MKRDLVDMLVCPACLPEEQSLTCLTEETLGEDIQRGLLECPRCGGVHPIRQGIADLIPAGVSQPKAGEKYDTWRVLSSYLWSHFADIMGDGDATAAYTEWASRIQEGPGPALDAGCAVGRMTFELSLRSDFAVGVDTSWAFVHTARQLMTRRGMDVRLIEEGRIQTVRRVELPDAWDLQNVEFVVADAQALPFRSEAFGVGASLNLVDKVADPIRHIEEMDRVLRRGNAQFLFSDPFSWSTDAAEEERWLGGRNEGAFTGFGADNVVRELRGKHGRVSVPWEIQETGSVWWKLRNHRNHFELIRSQFIKARR